MDIYLTASQFGKYPGLATSTSVNNCYLLFQISPGDVSGDYAGDCLDLVIWDPCREQHNQQNLPLLLHCVLHVPGLRIILFFQFCP